MHTCSDGSRSIQSFLHQIQIKQKQACDERPVHENISDLNNIDDFRCILWWIDASLCFFDIAKLHTEMELIHECHCIYEI